MPRWRWLLAQLTRRLWVRATLIGAMGVLAAILAAVVERYIPWDMPTKIGAEAVDSLLSILASSMLTVTTFSLSVMVTAYGSVTGNVTPRATRLLIEDRPTQNVLSTFVGSFLFGIVGLIVLKTGAYGDRGRVVLYIVTIAVIVLVVVSLLRWIDHLTRLGRVGETTDRVEEATREAIEARLREPFLGAAPLRDPKRDIPASYVPVRAEIIGYVQNIDVPALSRMCEERKTEIFVNAVPGTFVYPHTPLAWVARAGKADETDAYCAEVCDTFAIGDQRSFDQDPRFGLAVLSEVALRAMSPAVNDSGTAIDVIGRMTRLLSLWAEGDGDDEERKPRYPSVRVPSLATSDLFEDAFMLVARDGAGLIEVQLRLQKSLLALSRLGGEDFRAAARRQSQLAMERASKALALEGDRKRLREILTQETPKRPRGKRK
ncbi:MAG: DUF2254 domain-containing protein [Rhodobiaceae bacterium]|nr:DUF2254 domain-containing protein [Rhodobiaceae bacterium]MCC0057298.1 DUF2254 domain-containing protein [Rhodobiaceae bacterium]